MEEKFHAVILLSISDLPNLPDKVNFYFGLIDKGEPKSCDVKVKKRKKELLGENKVLR